MVNRSLCTMLLLMACLILNWFKADAATGAPERRTSSTLTLTPAEELELKAQLLEQKAEWERPASHFKPMTTEKLAEAILCNPMLAMNLAAWSGPRRERLDVVTEDCAGLAELRKRPDMWRGVLHATSALGERITSTTHWMALARIGMNLSGLGDFYQYAPEFKEQLKGRESMFFAAHLQILKRCQRSLNESMVLGKPLSVASVAPSERWIATQLLERIDPAAAEKAKQGFEKYQFLKEPTPEEMQGFLQLALRKLEPATAVGAGKGSGTR